MGVIVAFRDVTERVSREEKQQRHLHELERVHARLEVSFAFHKRIEEKLREADRRKDEFLAMLAHELRNPLAAISNAVKVMQMRGLRDPGLRWCRDVIERQVRHLTRLVDDLLDVSRIARGKITLRPEPLDLAAVVGRAVESSRPLIDAHRHTIDIGLQEEPVRVFGDPTRLVQVVMNLLNNAAKYTPDGGNIRLAVEKDREQAVLRVRDTGTGIAPDMLAKVFDLFTQVERTLDHCEGGLGLGLTLVRRLTELHGGTVEALSDGHGRGSEFVVRLPLLVDDRPVVASDEMRGQPQAVSPAAHDASWSWTATETLQTASPCS
jgi:signal transduction histidine kinase